MCGIGFIVFLIAIVVQHLNFVCLCIRNENILRFTADFIRITWNLTLLGKKPKIIKIFAIEFDLYFEDFESINFVENQKIFPRKNRHHLLDAMIGNRRSNILERPEKKQQRKFRIAVVQIVCWNHPHYQKEQFSLTHTLFIVYSSKLSIP